MAKTITKAQQNQLAMLGAAILVPDQATDCMLRLRAEMFEEGALREMFVAVQNLMQREAPVNVVSIENELGEGEHRRLITMAAETVPSTHNVEQYEQFVLEDYRTAVLIGKLNELVLGGMGSDAMCSQLRDALDQQEAIAQLSRDSSSADFASVLDATIANIEQPDTFLRLGWPVADSFGLFEKSNTIVISGRPGTGKTDFAIALAARFALRHKVYYLTLEEPKEKLMRRILSKATRIDASRMRDNNLSDDDLRNIRNAGGIIRSQHNMIFDDAQNLTPEGIYAKLLQHKPDIAFVDHIGLVTSNDPRANEYQRVTETTRKLKQIAMRLGIVIVELSQLNRGVDKTGGVSNAKLGDLRGSGSIEQDANAILFLENEINPDERISGADGYKEVTVRIGKNREGSPGRFTMHWQPQYHHWTPAPFDDFVTTAEPLPECVQERFGR